MVLGFSKKQTYLQIVGNSHVLVLEVYEQLVFDEFSALKSQSVNFGNGSDVSWWMAGQVLSCRVEVQTELVQQVLIFIMQSKHLGMVEVCEFLVPFLNYSIVRMPSSVSVSSFIRSFVSSLAGLCCSIPLESVPVLKLLIGRLTFFPCNNAEVSVPCIM